MVTLPLGVIHCMSLNTLQDGLIHCRTGLMSCRMSLNTVQEYNTRQDGLIQCKAGLKHSRTGLIHNRTVYIQDSLIQCRTGLILIRSGTLEPGLRQCCYTQIHSDSKGHSSMV